MTPDEEIVASAFFMADHAAVENGKLYVNGGFWNQLQLQEYPATVTFAIATVLTVRWHSQQRTHTFRIGFIDADGGTLPAEISGEFTVAPSPQVRDGEPTVMPIAAIVNNFTLATPGEYSGVLSVDDREIARWPFRAVALADGGVGGLGIRGLGDEPPSDDGPPRRPVSPSDLPNIF